MDDVSFELVQKDPDLECPICTEVIYLSPQQVLCCKKHFCESCIRRNAAKPCPLCRHKPLRYKDASREFINRLYSARVWCPNKRHGCTWSGRLATVEYHLYPYQSPIAADGCIYHVITCPQCNTKLLRGNLLKHDILDCPQSLLKKIDRKCENLEKKLKSLKQEPLEVIKQFSLAKENLEKRCSEMVSHVEGTELKLRTEILAQKEELRRANRRMEQLEADQEEHHKHKTSVPSRPEAPPIVISKPCECWNFQTQVTNMQNQIDLLTSSFDHAIIKVHRKVEHLEGKVQSSSLKVPQALEQLAKAKKEFNQTLKRVDKLQDSVKAMEQNQCMNLVQAVIKLQQIGNNVEARAESLNNMIEKSFQTRMKRKLDRPITRGEAIVISAVVFVVLMVIYHVLISNNTSIEDQSQSQLDSSKDLL